MTLNTEENKPNAYRVDDDSNLEEKDLQRSFLFGDADQEKTGDEPGMESNGAGGHSFGENNNTPAGDDKNNPSQNAGYTNEYFRRAEPLEEHPEFNNFKDPNQLGQSNYTQAAAASETGQSDIENTGPSQSDGEETGDEEQNRNESNQTYQEGTADNDGATQDDDNNVAGYGELPEQQKVGGDTSNNYISKPDAD